MVSGQEKHASSDLLGNGDQLLVAHGDALILEQRVQVTVIHVVHDNRDVFVVSRKKREEIKRGGEDTYASRILFRFKQTP